VQASPPDPLRSQPGDTHPVPVYTKELEYSEEGRKKRIEGSVTLSLVVTPEGDPTDIRVVKGLGYGLDEKAMETAAQYKFKPAMREGKPVPVRIMMQMQFKLY
jgi:TonB family protein